MTVVLDISKFRAILENLHTWAMRVLRPWISTYIDQWRARYPMPHEMFRGSGAEEEIHATPPSGGLSMFSDAAEAKLFMQGIFKDVLQPETNKLLIRINQMEGLLKENIREREHEQHHRLPAVQSTGIQTSLEVTTPVNQYNTQHTSLGKQPALRYKSQGTQYEVEPEPELDAQNGPSTLQFLHDVTEPVLYRTGTERERNCSSGYQLTNPSIFTTGVRVPYRRATIRIKFPGPKDLSSSELPSNISTEPFNEFSSKPRALEDLGLPCAISRPQALKFNFKHPASIMQRYPRTILPMRGETRSKETGRPLLDLIERSAEPGGASWPIPSSNLEQNEAGTKPVNIDDIDNGDEADGESSLGSCESQEEESTDDSDDSDYIDGRSDGYYSESEEESLVSEEESLVSEEESLVSEEETLVSDDNEGRLTGEDSDSMHSDSEGESCSALSDASYQESAVEGTQGESDIDGIQDSPGGSSAEAKELQLELEELKEELAQDLEQFRWEFLAYKLGLTWNKKI